MNITGRVFCAGTLCIGIIASITAIDGHQAAAPTHAPTFEVASIRQSTTEVGGGGINSQPGGRFTANGVTLRRLIFSAYNMPMARILEGPEWINRIRFDVNARAEGNVTPEQLRQLQQTLLRDRFNLVVRRETRELPVYALQLARADRRLGPQLKPAAVNCADAHVRAAAPEYVPGTQRPSCGQRTTPTSWRGGGVPLIRLIESLAQTTGRPVVDRTRLTGTFDLELEWAATVTADPSAQPAEPSKGPSLFTAIREQLGLTLDAAAAPVDVLVVESATLPTDN